MDINIFGRGRENEVMSLFLGHSRNMVEATKLLATIPKAQKAETEKIAKKIFGLEHECDDMKRKVFRFLSLGAFMPAVREKLYHLVEQMDEVIDEVQDSAGLFLFMDRHKGDPEFRKATGKLISKSVEALSALNDEVVADFSNKECDFGKVDAVEDECDALKIELYEKVFSKQRTFNEGKIMTELIDSLSRISDRAEDAADTLVSLRLIFKP